MKWWQTQARAKLQPAGQEIRAAQGMWAQAERGRGGGKATKLKPRQWDWMDGWSCRFSADLDLLHPGTSGPKRSLFLASKLQWSPRLSEHQEGNTGLGWAGLGLLPATTSPELGQVKPSVLGARSYCWKQQP